MHHDAIATASTPSPRIGDGTDLGPALRSYVWRWQGKSIVATYEVLGVVGGAGKPILLLPALSTISSREEMRGLAAYFAPKHPVVLLDWIGFGDSDRPNLAYNAGLYKAFLRDFVQATFAEPIVVMAAGHSAGAVMELAQKRPAPWAWVVLLAPTYRGPLPTMMGEKRRKFYQVLQQLINLPVLGQFLYFLNTTGGFLRWMMGRHVFSDLTHITRDLMRRKKQVARKSGGRFAAAAFVTGALDPIRSRTEWIDWFQPLPVPVMVVIGDHLPPKSREEMEVLAHFTSVQVFRTHGSLGLHEEYPDQVASGVLPFLDKYLSVKKDDASHPNPE